MTEFSPQAQAVKDAVLALYSDEKVHKFGWQLDAPTVASALRAVADQVVPTEMDLPPIAPDLGHFRQHERRLTRQRLLAIADELEALPD
jgi:hypothetical protein